MGKDLKPHDRRSFFDLFQIVPTTEEYGKVIPAYHGNGKVRFEDASEFTCGVCIEQVEKGMVLIRCLFNSTGEKVTGFLNTKVDSVYGQVEDGLRFATYGKIFTKGWNDTSTDYSRRLVLTLVTQEVALRQEIERPVTNYKFGVVNFEFTGNCSGGLTIATEIGETKSLYYYLQLKMPWGTVVVDPVPDYGHVIRGIKAQKGISVTCEVLVKTSTVLDFPDVILKLDELCRLLSLARGTKLNWINAEAYTEDGHIQQIVLKNSITWPFSSFPLIDPYSPDDTLLFIEKAYSTYLELRDSYSLDVAIEQLLDAKRETAYLESRALAAVALLDSLQQQYAYGHGFDRILKEFRGQQQEEFRSHLSELVVSSFPSVNFDDLNEILGKAPELNRRSFLSLLKLWTSHLGLKIPNDELSTIRDTRHSLAHTGRFTSTDQSEKLREYYRIINLVSQVLLKLLDYDGYFINVDLETLSFCSKQMD